MTIALDIFAIVCSTAAILINIRTLRLQRRTRAIITETQQRQDEIDDVHRQ